MALRLVLLDPDGGRRPVLIDIGRCFCLGFSPGLSWSPDGRQLAYGSLTDMMGGLFVANADGTDPRHIATGVSGPLAWRPAPAAPPD